MNKAINRTTVQVDNNKYRVYPKAAPLFYKKSDGTYGDIDHTFNDTTSTIGDISLMDKGVVSVGKRKGNNPHKVVGIRPDNNQHLGTQQLEFSLVNVELDGESQDFNVEDDLEIKLKASKVYQLVKINKDFRDFKIEFDIYSKGIELQNEKYTESTTIRDYGFNLIDLGEIDTSNTDLSLDSLFNEDKDIPYIDCRICKITNDYITTGEYSIEEEFGDSDLSEYMLDNKVYSRGSSVYYKDSILFITKTYNIENYEQIMINNLCSLYGLENFDDGGNGKYLTKNGKKVIGYYSTENNFLAFINTKAIPDEIKTLFKRKTFNDTSYLDITLSDFITSISNRFNKDFKIDLDNNYYEPINNKFVFNINNEKMYIGLPLLFDENYNNLVLGTTHSLKQNNDGSYRYIKYFSTKGYLLYLNNAKYIDATLYVSDSEDNKPIYGFSASSTTKKTSANFTTARNATTGTGQALDNAFSQDVTNNICGDFMNYTAGSQGNSATYSWYLYQTHYIFDSSGVTDTISDLEWKQKGSYYTEGGSHDDISVIVLKSNTEGSNNATNWNDFVGHTSGWDSDDVTEYSSETVIDGFEGLSADDQVWETMVLNSDAKTDLKNDSSFKIAVVDYDQYYQNSLDTSYGGSTVDGKRTFLAFDIDNSDSDKRPYLEYTVASGSVTYDANFFGANF